MHNCSMLSDARKVLLSVFVILAQSWCDLLLQAGCQLALTSRSRRRALLSEMLQGGTITAIDETMASDAKFCKYKVLISYRLSKLGLYSSYCIFSR